jgi:beta-galactosidase
MPVIEIPPIGLQPFTSVWDKLPPPVLSVQPKPMEAFSQDYGFILYRTELVGHKSGKLVVTDLHDYATVFLNGVYIGKLDRREGINSIEIPAGNVKVPVLEILVEAMGRINFGEYIIDRKGITDRVTLNGMTLMNWKVFNLPMDKKYIFELRSSGKTINKPGIFFRGNFFLETTSDTFFDLTNYTKGILWINGHNLGRFWNIGPQKRLYCPASWLSTGLNEILIFDIHLTEPKPVLGMKTLE